MIQELPNLEDFFNSEHNEKKPPAVQTEGIFFSTGDISISLARQDDHFINAQFVDIAPGGIGIHVLLPVVIDFTPQDLKNISLRFERNTKKQTAVIKEVQCLIRWYETDQLSGKQKVGLHFHGETKNDRELRKILLEMKKNSAK